MNYHTRFVVEPGRRVRLDRIDPWFTGRHESHAHAAAAEPVPVAPAPSAAGAAAPATARPPPSPGAVRSRHVAWAELLRRTFGRDVLACPDCGGRLHRVATLAEPRVIARLLTTSEPPAPAPPRQPWLPAAAH